MGPRADLDPVGKRKIFCLCRESKHNSSIDLFVASRYTDSQVKSAKFQGVCGNFEGEKRLRMHVITVPFSSITLLPMDDSIRNKG